MFREGARIFDPLDLCPKGHQCCHFASDFRLMGKHSVRVCTHDDCRCVYENGEKKAELLMNAPPKEPDGGPV